MGKKPAAPAAPDSGKKATGDKAAASSSNTASSKAKPEKVPERTGLMSKFRPSPNPIFFASFVLVCAWVLFFYRPCDVKGKKADCGYSGISPMMCRTSACFTKSPKPFDKKVIKVPQEAGTSLGLELDKVANGLYVVKAVQEGAVRKHNTELADDAKDSAVLPGDRIVRIGSARGDELLAAVRETGARTATLEIQRSRLPSLLQFVHSTSGKPGLLEKVLTSPGFQHFAGNAFALAKIAVGCWYISGYPLASLPTYMFLSGATSLQLSRCCHDEAVESGVPHCYTGKREAISDIFPQVWAQTAALATRVAQNPRSYFDWLFVPGK